MSTIRKYYLTSYKNNEKSKHLFLRNAKKHNPQLTLFKKQFHTVNKITLYDPDEEYVTKLNYFNINNPELQFSDSKITTYNLNPLPQLTSIIKKDKGNVESFNSKKKLLNELTSKKNIFDCKMNNSIF